MLNVRLVMVMGHRRCGAVSSAVEATLKAETEPDDLEFDASVTQPRSYVEALVAKIQPAVDHVRHAPGDLLDNAVRANADLMVRRLRKRSSIINEAVTSGQVKLVGAVYDLDTGLVNLNK